MNETIEGYLMAEWAHQSTPRSDSRPTTLTPGADLLHAVCDAPHDDAPRLAYAEWLDANGGAPHAELIRVQCELSRRFGTPAYGLDFAGWSERHKRAGDDERALMTRCRRLLGAPMLPYVLPLARAFGVVEEPAETCEGRYRNVGTVMFSRPDRLIAGQFGWQRGFVEAIHWVSARDWLEYGPAVVQLHPVTRLELRGCWGYGNINGVTVYYVEADNVAVATPWLFPATVEQMMDSATRLPEDVIAASMNATALAWARREAGLAPLVGV